MTDSHTPHDPTPPDLNALGTLPEARIKALTDFEGEMGEINRMVEALGQTITGNFDITLHTDSEHPVVQKMALMLNFMLQSARSAIAQRERADKARESQKFLRQLINLQPDIIYTMDTEGRLTLINQAACDFFGVPIEEAIGNRPSEIKAIRPRTAQLAIDILRHVVSTGQPVLNLEERVRSASGKIHWFQSSHVPVLDDEGHITQVLSVMTDVTELREAGDQMFMLINELRDAIKFKDQFMAVMSHELRTPLNAIMGFTGIALMAGDTSAQMTKMLERIDFNARRLASLINDLLDLSRINAGRVEILWEKVNIHELAQAWYDSFLPRISAKNVEFVMHLAPDLPELIETDPDRLTQIANNLLTNASKFTESGSITLTLRRAEDPALWELEVSDTGIGISEAYQQAIFEEFRQVEAGMQSKYGGTGLGLSIVQKLCRLMDGQIRVKSALGEGSTFTATLPLRRPKTSRTNV